MNSKNCEYCKEGAFNVLIDNNVTLYADNVWGSVVVFHEPDKVDMSLVFEMRCGSGYLRLGDIAEMSCIDHAKKFKVDNCIGCGRELDKE